MHIEFIGPPGSGKSTIRQAAIARLGALDSNKYIPVEKAFRDATAYSGDKFYRHAVNYLPEKLSLRLANRAMGRSLMFSRAQQRFLAEYGKCMAAFIESPVYDNMSVNDRAATIGHFLESAGVWQSIESASHLTEASHAIIFDESLLQKTSMFVDHCDSDAQSYLTAYLQMVPVSGLVISVQTDADTCHQRLLSRERGLPQRLGNQEPETIRRYLQKTIEHFEFLQGWLENHSKAQLLVLDQEPPVDRAAEQLAEKIVQCVGS